RLQRDIALETAAASQATARLDLTLVELGNKYETHNLVRNLDGLMPLPKRGDSLLQLLERTRDFEPFTRIWLIEGIGHYYTLLYVHDSELRGLLNGPAASDLPLTSMMMLHAGLGLGLAQNLLARTNPCAADNGLESAVDRFMTM